MTSRWIVAALLASAAIAAEAPGLTLTGPSSSAQMNVFYSSSFGASGGKTPYTFTISSGNLPNGLNLNASTGAVTGTPTVAGTFSFTGRVSDTAVLTDPNAANSGTDGLAAARRKTFATTGKNDATTSNDFQIVVAPAAPSPTPVPPSVWMALTGLAGAGVAGLRRKRRA